MSDKIYVTDIERAPQSQVGATLESLSETIRQRHESGDASSYTSQLLSGPLDKILKKVSEEALEVGLAANECEMLALLGGCADGDAASTLDASIDHLRYESADVVYHLLVLLERFCIDIDEFAAELNYRMREDERPEGCVLLHDEHVKRGK